MLAATAVTAQAAYRARHAPWDLAFVLLSYAALSLLFICLSMYERLSPPPPLEQGKEDDGVAVKRWRLKMAVWALSTALSVAFAWRVAAAMPAPAMMDAIWAMTSTGVVASFFYALLGYRPAISFSSYSELHEEETLVAGSQRRRRRPGHRRAAVRKPAGGEAHALAVHQRVRCSSAFLRLAVLVFLTFCFVQTARPADPWDFTIVITAGYANLTGLFLVLLRQADHLTPVSPWLLRGACWALSTAYVSAYRIAWIMLTSMVVTVWAMTATVIAGISGLIVPAATVMALVYGYLWWKGIFFASLTYVTKSDMANAVSSMTKHLEPVESSLAAAKRHLTQRIEELDHKLDQQKALCGQIRDDVTYVRLELKNIYSEIKNIRQLICSLDEKMGSIEAKQNKLCDGVMYLCKSEQKKWWEAARTPGRPNIDWEAFRKQKSETGVAPGLEKDI